MKPRDLAKLLLRKAENDIAAFTKLRSDPEIAAGSFFLESCRAPFPLSFFILKREWIREYFML